MFTQIMLCTFERTSRSCLNPLQTNKKAAGD